LAELVKWLIKERHRVLFFTTDAPDAATVDDIQTLISGSAIHADAVQTLAGSMEQSPDSLLKEISRADLTIASRLHGVILSHLNGTPVLALSFDPKVDAHMKAVGQQDYCLNIDNLQLDTLIERFNSLRVFREREAALIRCKSLAFRQQLDTQYDRILGISHSSSVTSDCHPQIDASPLSEIGAFRTK
jgi:polysaccharide pyruvyl transferase WcaK-like protein